MTHQHHHPTISAKPMSRRTMLKAMVASTVAVGAGAAFATSANAAGQAATAAAGSLSGGQRLVPVNRIGIQLFTVRDRISSLGFRAVFEELSNLGFSEVEFAGYTQGSVGAITPAEIRSALDDNGLKAIGCHTTINEATIDQQIEIGLTLGMPSIGASGPGRVTETGENNNSVAAWQRGAELWNRLGEKAVAAGLGPLYAHNHTAEFAPTFDDPSRRVYDVLWDEYDNRYANFEMDVYWAYAAAHVYPGFEPIDWVKRDHRRFQRFHLKDGKINPANANGYDIVAFGEGDLPYTEFLSQLRDKGQRAGILEQDTAGNWNGPTGTGSFAAAEFSYNNIASLRG